MLQSDAESGYVQLVDTLLSHEDKESETLNLLTSSESGVFTITMNRPSKKNALTTEVYYQYFVRYWLGMQ